MHARALLDEACQLGVREVVLCPGSRSAPLAYAALAAAEAGRLRLHVRVDERSAGFLALGLAKTSRRPALVVTTSGTAVANLHPSVLEAHHAAVPLIVMSADRPAELRYSGANQTTVQPGIFAGALRWESDVPAPVEGDDPRLLRGFLRQAYAAATAPVEPGPVHLNLCFREPLVPAGWPLDDEVAPSEQGSAPQPVSEPESEPGSKPASEPSSPPGPFPHLERTVVLLGDLVDPANRPVVSRFAAARGYPLIAEPFGLYAVDGALPHGPLTIADPGFLENLAADGSGVERVLVVGRLTLSRAVTALLRRPEVRVEAVTDRSRAADPAGVVSASYPFAALTQDGAEGDSDPSEHQWLARWQREGDRVAEAIAAEPPAWGTGLGVARAVARGIPAGAVMFVGSSNPVRDLDLGPAGVAEGVTVVASRGLAGIDGCVATAAGVALAEGAAYAVMGDLTFLHDANALLIGPHEPVPNLTLVVVNDDGGGIFRLLEPGEEQRAGAFERIFATATQTDLRALCHAHGVSHRLVNTADDLVAELARTPSGLRVLEVRVDPSTHRAAHAALRDQVRLRP